MSDGNKDEATFEQRLHAYADLFRNDFRRRDQARWIGVYLKGLLQEGERKSVETLAKRVPLPFKTAIDQPAQALQHFVNQSPWDERKLWRRYRALLAKRLAGPDGVFVIKNVTFPKQGRHSVGVQRQYSSDWGKKINCQIGVSLHYQSPAGYFPLGLRLYLPNGWFRSPHQLMIAGVPPQFSHYASKGKIALQLLDEVRAEGLPGRCLVAAEGYGGDRDLREGLEERGLPYLVGVPGETTVLPEGLFSGKVGRGPASLTLRQLATRTPLHPLPGHGLGLGRFAWIRVASELAGALEVRSNGQESGVLIEESVDGSMRFARGNLPLDGGCPQAVRLWHSHQAAEQGYRLLKDQMGLNQFEGRSWRGFHHHACLVMLGYGFRVMEKSELSFGTGLSISWRNPSSEFFSG